MSELFGRMDRAVGGLHTWEGVVDGLRTGADFHDNRHFHRAAGWLEAAVAETGGSEWPTNDSLTAFLVLLELLSVTREVEGDAYVESIKRLVCETVARA